MATPSPDCVAFVRHLHLNNQYPLTTPLKFKNHHSNSTHNYSLDDITDAIAHISAAPSPHTPVPPTRLHGYPGADHSPVQTSPASADLHLHVRVADSDIELALSTELDGLRYENSRLRAEAASSRQQVTELQQELSYCKDQLLQSESTLGQLVQQRDEEDLRLHGAVDRSRSLPQSTARPRSSLVGEFLMAPSMPVALGARESHSALERAKQHRVVSSLPIPSVPALHFPLTSKISTPTAGQSLAERLLALAEYFADLRKKVANVGFDLLTASGHLPADAVRIVSQLLISEWKDKAPAVYFLWESNPNFGADFPDLASFFGAAFECLSGPVSETSTLGMYTETLRSCRDFLQLSVALRKLANVSDVLDRVSSLPPPNSSQLALTVIDAVPSNMRAIILTRARQQHPDQGQAFQLNLRNLSFETIQAAIESLAMDAKTEATFSGPPSSSSGPPPSPKGSTPPRRGKVLPSGDPTVTGPAATAGSGSPSTRPESQRPNPAFARNTAGSAENPTPSLFCVFCLRQQRRITKSGPHQGKPLGLNHNYASCKQMTAEDRAQSLALAQRHESLGTLPAQAVQQLFPAAMATLPRADSVPWASRPPPGLSGPRVLLTGPAAPTSAWPPAATYPGPYSSWSPSEFGPVSPASQPSALVSELMLGAAGHHYHAFHQPSTTHFPHPPSPSAQLYSSAPAASPAAGGPGVAVSPLQGNEPPLR